MTGAEIRRSAELYSGKPIEVDMALTGINQAMRKIGDMGLLYGEITIEGVQAGETYLLPKDLIHLFSIVDSGGKQYNNYALMGDKIVFGDSGNYVIHARKLSKKLESLEDEPDVHEAYHGSLVEYLQRYVLEATSSDAADKVGNYTNFEKTVATVFQMLRRRRVPKQMEVIR